MPSGRLLVVPHDLREAAQYVEQRGDEFAQASSSLRLEWQRLAAESEYLAEAGVEAACERAFRELMHSQQICAELARVLRLTADALEDADRRASALLRRRDGGSGSVPISLPCSSSGTAGFGDGRGGSGGGRGGFGDEDHSLGDWLERRIEEFKLLYTLSFLIARNALVRKKVNGREFLSFRPADSLISPRYFGIEGGVARSAKDFVKRFEVIELEGLKGIGTLLSLLEKGIPLIKAAEALGEQGLHLAVLPHLVDFGLQFTKRANIFAGTVAEVYEALTSEKYEGKREAAVLVKALTPVISTAASVAVGAALTAICPAGAPVLFTVAAAAAKVVADFAVEDLLDTHQDALINFVDTHLIDPNKAALEATTANVIESIEQAGRDFLKEPMRWLGPIGNLPSLDR